MRSDMSLQRLAFSERLIANRTVERFLTSVHSNMNSQSRRAGERFLTVYAREWFFSCMCSNMIGQLRVICKRFRTMRTRQQRFLHSVTLFMFSEGIWIGKIQTALFTFTTFVGMWHFVFLRRTWVLKRFSVSFVVGFSSTSKLFHVLQLLFFSVKLSPAVRTLMMSCGWQFGVLIFAWNTCWSIKQNFGLQI